MHLYAVVYSSSLLVELSTEGGSVQFFWADDPNHAMEQARAAAQGDTIIPVVCAQVPDDYVLVPRSSLQPRLGSSRR